MQILIVTMPVNYKDVLQQKCLKNKYQKESDAALVSTPVP